MALSGTWNGSWNLRRAMELIGQAPQPINVRASPHYTGLDPARPGQRETARESNESSNRAKADVYLNGLRHLEAATSEEAVEIRRATHIDRATDADPVGAGVSFDRHADQPSS